MKKKLTFVCSIISSALYLICLCANFFNILLFKTLSSSQESFGPTEYTVIPDTTEYYLAVLRMCRIFAIFIIVGLILSILSIFISKSIENYKKHLWIPILNILMLLCFPIFNVIVFCLYNYLLFTIFVSLSYVTIAVIDIIDLMNNKRELRKYNYEKLIKDQQTIADLLSDGKQCTGEFDSLIVKMNAKKSKYDKYNKMFESNLISKKEYMMLIENLNEEDKNK